MQDFSKLSEEKIVDFVNENFSLFASERADEFPSNVLDGMARGVFAFVRRAEGFAIAYKGKRYSSGNGYRKANLMFLYVAAEHEGKGVGKQLVEQIKVFVTPDVPITLTCEGERRKNFFERCGFTIQIYDPEIDLYELRWAPLGVD